jgi:hypothetical protein
MRLTITLLTLTLLAACSAPFEGSALTGPLPDAAAPEAAPTSEPSSVSPDAGPDGASPDSPHADGQSPVDAASGDTDGGTGDAPIGVEVLASKQVVPSGLAVGGGNVFWTTEGADPDFVGNVFALSLSDPTATPTAIATNQKYPRALTFVDGALYWGTYGDGAIGKWTATTGPSNVGAGPNGLEAVAADSTHVYFAMEINRLNMPPTGAVARCPLDGCRGAPEIVATAEAKIIGLDIHEGALFWSVYSVNNGAIYRLTLDGTSSPRALAVGLALPLNVAAFGGFVYWGNVGSGTVARVSADADGATPTILASNQTRPWGIAADDRGVYWTTYTQAGQVMKLAHGTSAPIVLASDQPSPGHVRVDADFAYWTNTGDGSIRRVPK